MRDDELRDLLAQCREGESACAARLLAAPSLWLEYHAGLDATPLSAAAAGPSLPLLLQGIADCGADPGSQDLARALAASSRREDPQADEASLALLLAGAAPDFAAIDALARAGQRRACLRALEAAREEGLGEEDPTLPPVEALALAAAARAALGPDPAGSPELLLELAALRFDWNAPACAEALGPLAALDGAPLLAALREGSLARSPQAIGLLERGQPDAYLAWRDARELERAVPGASPRAARRAL